MRCTPDEEEFLRDLPGDLVAAGWRLVACGRPPKLSAGEGGVGCTVIYRWPESENPIVLNHSSVKAARDAAIPNMRGAIFSVHFDRPEYRLDVDVTEFNDLIPGGYLDQGWRFAYIAGHEPAKGVFDWAPTEYLAVLERHALGDALTTVADFGFTPEDACRHAVQRLEDTNPE